MQYRTFFECSLLPAGPAPHPSAPPSDAGDNPPWNRKTSAILLSISLQEAINVSTLPTVQPVPYWTDGRQGLTYRGFTGVLQHI